MTASHTPKIEDVTGLLSALRLSTDHLVQLIEMQELEATEALDGPIVRALAAHSAIVASLGETIGKQAQSIDHPEDPPSPVTPDQSQQSSWVEAPWRYLNISSKDKGQLGPMPRFVPVPTHHKKD